MYTVQHFFLSFDRICSVDIKQYYEATWQMDGKTDEEQSWKNLLHYKTCREFLTTNEPCHEIIVLFDVRKLTLHTCMRSHPVGLDVWFLVGPFPYFHTSWMRIAKALARLRRLAWAGHLCDKYHNLMSWLIWCVYVCETFILILFLITSKVKNIM